MTDVPLEAAAGCAEWPCEWPCDITGYDAAKLDAAKQIAVSLLWSYGGRNVGECTWVEGYYPPGRQCHEGGPWGPYKTLSGEWRNGSWVRDCCKIRLRHSPAIEVTAVFVFGVALDPSGYVLDADVLRRQGECWPWGWDCDKPPVIVVYTAGFPLPAITPWAVGEVACEALRGLSGDPCRLPTTATTVQRQGVVVQLADPVQTAKRRRLGLPIADAWLEEVNPNALPAPSRVYSPDLPRRGR